MEKQPVILICGDRLTGKTTVLCEALARAAQDAGGRSMLVVDTYDRVDWTERLLRDHGWLEQIHVDTWAKTTRWEGWRPAAIGLDEPSPGYSMDRLPGPVTHMTICTPTSLSMIETRGKPEERYHWALTLVEKAEPLIAHLSAIAEGDQEQRAILDEAFTWLDNHHHGPPQKRERR